MPLLPKFDPPGNLPDFADASKFAAQQAAATQAVGANVVGAPLDPKPTAADQWHSYISACFDVSIAELLASIPNPPGQPHTPQFFNASRVDAGPDLIEQPVYWNAFPKRLLSRFGRRRALEAADMLWPRSEFKSNTFDPFEHVNLQNLEKARNASALDLKGEWIRPQDEYCEWRVERDEAGDICRVTFTSEPPEYWTALYGGDVTVGDTDLIYRFDGNPAFCAKLYSDFLSRTINPADLQLPGGGYNPTNCWNTTRGIVHLSNVDVNSIAAEIKLAADSTVLRAGYQGPATHWSSTRGLTVYPEQLCCVSRYGDPMRNSDPTIGACGNALARTGALFTLKNPVGIYMDHIDTSGWELKDGSLEDWATWCRIVRGDRGAIERLVVEAPAGSVRKLEELMIGGEALEFGGQLAECITVKLIGVGTIGHHLSNPVALAAGQGWMSMAEPFLLTARRIGESQENGERMAFGASVSRAGKLAAAPLRSRRRGTRRLP